MRILLAIIAFVLAAPLLGYAGLMAYSLYVLSEFFNDPDMAAEFNTAMAAGGGALVLGLAFVAAGVAVLSSRPRRE